MTTKTAVVFQAFRLSFHNTCVKTTLGGPQAYTWWLKEQEQWFLKTRTRDHPFPPLETRPKHKIKRIGRNVWCNFDIEYITTYEDYSNKQIMRCTRFNQKSIFTVGLDVHPHVSSHVFRPCHWRLDTSYSARDCSNIKHFRQTHFSVLAFPMHAHAALLNCVTLQLNFPA